MSSLARLISARAWYFGAAVWALWSVTIGGSYAFRIFKASPLRQQVRIEDIPLLEFWDTNYPFFYAGSCLLAGGVAWIAIGLFRTRIRFARVVALVLVGNVALCEFRLVGSSRPEWPRESLVDWIAVTLVFASGLLLARAQRRTCMPSAATADSPTPIRQARRWHGRATRLAVIYVLCTLAVASYAFVEHYEFWRRPEMFTPVAEFFGREYVFEATLLLYSTSFLFASLAGIIATLAYVVFCGVIDAGRDAPRELSDRKCRRIAMLIAATWTFTLIVPWMIKVLPEIRRVDGWLYPISVMTAVFSAIVPLAHHALCRMQNDAQVGHARIGELALFTFWTFPFQPVTMWRRALPAFFAIGLVGDLVRYGLAATGVIDAQSFWWIPAFPWLAVAFGIGAAVFALRRSQVGLLALLTGYLILHATRFSIFVTDWFDFDDWRGMMRRGEFPFLRVFFALVAVWAIFLLLERVIDAVHGALRRGQRRSGWRRYYGRLWRPGQRLMSAASFIAASFILLAASFPFWGWGSIRENTFSRAIEFNDRHEFELSFLHWVFDADRDGYAGVLHGADIDDFDASLQAGALPRIEAQPVPTLELEVVDPARARAMPSIALLFLEGVQPAALNLYGKRHLNATRSPTENIDRVASEGTAFSRCRCAYPSTWDGWLETCAGRYVKITEFSSTALRGDRYSRLDMIHKVCRKVGFDRYCFANCLPWVELNVPPGDRLLDVEGDCDTDPTPEERDREIWVGDKQTDRIVRFVESLQKGERFFLCEHMEDSHFPWKRTSRKRAAEIGFPEGLEWVEADHVPGSDSHAAYLQEITRVDSQIGRILQAIRDAGRWNDTLIVIIGDHGCQWYEHEHRYYVSHLYEQAINPALIIRVPGLGHQPICDARVQQVDLVPTLVELAGLRVVGAAEALPGISLVPFLRGVASADDYDHARMRNMLLTTHYDKLGYVEANHYKLIFERPFGTYRLFDLEADPNEMVNLVDRDPELFAHMQRSFQQHAVKWMELLGGPRKPDSPPPH